MLPLTADEIGALFEADYVEVEVAPDGTIHTAVESESVETATRSLKRERTWYER